MSTVLVAATLLGRFLRRPATIPLLLLVPLALTLLLAAGYGATARARMGVTLGDTSGPARDILAALPLADPSLDVVVVPDEATLRDLVERGALGLGIVVPAGSTATLASGGTLAVTLLARQTELAPILRQLAAAAVAEAAATTDAARVAAAMLDLPDEEVVRRATAARDGIASVRLDVETTGSTTYPPLADPFGLAARSLLVLVAFLAPLLAVPLVVADAGDGVLRGRHGGRPRRAALLAGEALGLVLVALVPILALVLGSGILLGVAWGDPVGVGLLVVAIAFVAGGIGLAVSVVLRRGGSLVTRLVIAIVAAALGGAIVPIELFDGDLLAAARLLPQGPALEAARRLLLEGSDAAGIAPQLAALALVGAAAMTIGLLGLGRAVARASAGAGLPPRP